MLWRLVGSATQIYSYAEGLHKCMFGLYVRILNVSSSATAISTPDILSSAVLCLNVFLIILIISHYPSTRKLCKLLLVLKKTRLMTTYQPSPICTADGRIF